MRDEKEKRTYCTKNRATASSQLQQEREERSDGESESRKNKSERKTGAMFPMSAVPREEWKEKKEVVLIPRKNKRKREQHRRVGNSCHKGGYGERREAKETVCVRG